MKKLLFIFLCVFLCLVSGITIFAAKPIDFSDKQEENTAALDIWHIDMFEGGVGSRGEIIKSAAKEYYKKKGVLVNVKIHTVFSAEESFKKGVYPDIISYSAGLKLPHDRLKKMGNGKVLGSYKGEIFAKPWCFGGYVYIARKNEKIDGLIISTQEFSLPYLACGYSGLDLPVKEEVDSAKAIYSFYRKKNCALIGTQRDIFRLLNKGYDLEIKPLPTYNDLYQYMSILSNENFAESLDFIESFIEKTESGGVLKRIGMLAPSGYSAKTCSEELSVFDKIKYKLTVSPFLPADKLTKLRELSKDFSKNAENIKNFVEIIEIN